VSCFWCNCSVRWRLVLLVYIQEVLSRSSVSRHHWFSFTPATDAFSLSPAVIFLRFRLCFHFKQALLSVFVVGFHLPLDLCVYCCLFLGEDV